jgi:hypothetical protein
MLMPKQGTPAAVEADRDLALLETGETADALEDRVLYRVTRQPIARERSPELVGEGEQPRMLARAVVMQCGRRLPMTLEVARRLGVQRRMCSALQILDAMSRAHEQRRHAVDVHRLPTVRGRDQRDVLGAEAETLGGAARDQRHGLERLRRRAPEGDLVQRIADREAELAVR